MRNIVSTFTKTLTIVLINNNTRWNGFLFDAVLCVGGFGFDFRRAIFTPQSAKATVWVLNIP